MAPPTRTLTLEGLDAELPVWDGRVDFVVPVHVDYRIASLVEGIEDDEIPIEIEVAYQSCDGQTCGIPRRETLALRVPLSPHVGNDLAGELAGAVSTTMNSRKHMWRMVLRGLRQSPIRGLSYVATMMLELRRNPVAMRKRRAAKTNANLIGGDR